MKQQADRKDTERIMRWDTNVMSSRDSSIIFYLDASLPLSLMLALFFCCVLEPPPSTLSTVLSFWILSSHTGCVCMRSCECVTVCAWYLSHNVACVLYIHPLAAFGWLPAFKAIIFRVAWDFCAAFSSSSFSSATTASAHDGESLLLCVCAVQMLCVCVCLHQPILSSCPFRITKKNRKICFQSLVRAALIQTW